MEKSLKAAEEFRERALRAIQEAKAHLKSGFLESAVSTTYYGCFYSVHSQLARLGIEASSHKQAGIEFRRHFIKSKKLAPRFSEVWQALSEWRMEVDYDPTPEIDPIKARELVSMGEEFVTAIFSL